ncbi:GntR family transcriptional regulator [Lacticaseibacillus zeae]|uniref:GntR family transcriptional regulator n=1 Tax=Lacticaseibacillus zeae TaxID=57037 RepID=A0A5R8LQQ0_LACZE|nr:GntR family transcriptional regulator [Lacticaseibacillus zeae]TLF39551.1 GntR family transcriptional regulator [Lacticaseibacillus zeae]
MTKYQEIADNIAQSIRNGEYPDKLPTEADLISRYQAGRNTIRRAIDVVYRSGLLRRVQGSGFYVNHMPATSNAIINLVTRADVAMHNKHQHLTSHVITFDKIKAGSDLAQSLDVSQSSELYRVVRLRYLHAALYCLEVAYFTLQAVPFLSTEAVNHSIFEFLHEAYQIRISDSENLVRLAMLTAEQAAVMKQPVGRTVLALDQTNYYGKGVPLNYSTSYYVYPDLGFYSRSFPVTAG